MREDGSGLMTVLTEEGRITAFAFDPAGDIWYTVLTGEGGALCRASHDGWGATAEQVVTQIDGRRLTYPAAVAARPRRPDLFYPGGGLWPPGRQPGRGPAVRADRPHRHRLGLCL